MACSRIVASLLLGAVLYYAVVVYFGGVLPRPDEQLLLGAETMTFLDLRPYVLGLLGLGVAAFLWFGVRGLVGRVGGWDSLANAYHVDELPSGERTRFASGLMGDELAPVRYRNILNVVVNSSGFGLSIQSVFGQAPSIFIPWTHVLSASQSRVMFVDTVVIKVRGAWPTISLYGQAGASVLQAYGQSLSKPAL